MNHFKTYNTIGRRPRRRINAITQQPSSAPDPPPPGSRCVNVRATRPTGIGEDREEWMDGEERIQAEGWFRFALAFLMPL